MTSEVSIYIKAVHVFLFSWENPKFEQVSGQTPEAKVFNHNRAFFFCLYAKAIHSLVDKCSLLLVFIKGGYEEK